MTSTTQTAAPLTFDAFWRWLLDHRNCVLRVSAGEMSILDHDLIHWDFFDEDDGRAVCQASIGKTLVGEVVITRTEILFVQSSPDVETPNSGAWNFECIGGPREETYPHFTFAMAHGLDGAQRHQVLKH